MNLSTILTLAALLFSIGNGIGRITIGRKIWMTHTSSFKRKLRPITITRYGENTRPFAVSTFLSGIICILITIILLVNAVYDPLALVICSLVGCAFVEVPGLEISESRFRSESN